MLTDGSLQVLAIFDKPDPLDGPFFEETIYVTPTSLDAASQRHLVVASSAGAATRSACATGRFTPSAASVPTGVVVLEVAARPIGGMCSRVLRFDATGSSLEGVLLRHARRRGCVDVMCARPRRRR